MVLITPVVLPFCHFNSKYVSPLHRLGDEGLGYFSWTVPHTALFNNNSSFKLVIGLLHNSSFLLHFMLLNILFFYYWRSCLTPIKEGGKKSLSLSTVVYTIPYLNIWTFVWIRRDKRYVSTHVKLIIIYLVSNEILTKSSLTFIKTKGIGNKCYEVMSFTFLSIVYGFSTSSFPLFHWIIKITFWFTFLL